MSRNVEVLNEVVEESLRNPITAIEDMAADICRKLLVHHEYSSEYFRSSKTPLGRDTFEMFTLLAGGHIVRDGPLTKTVGVKVTGMTACPCAQQTVTEMLEYSGDMPVMSHNQRNVCTIMMTMPEDVTIERGRHHRGGRADRHRPGFLLLSHVRAPQEARRGTGRHQRPQEHQVRGGCRQGSAREDRREVPRAPGLRGRRCDQRLRGVHPQARRLRGEGRHAAGGSCASSSGLYFLTDFSMTEMSQTYTSSGHSRSSRHPTQ